MARMVPKDAHRPRIDDCTATYSDITRRLTLRPMMPDTLGEGE
jgi:hypothetical protein